MQNEKEKRIARRFMDDDKPCAVAREGRVHTLAGDCKIVPVDKFSFEKTKQITPDDPIQGRQAFS